jgi:Flp pilus assembly pilin Flp
MSLKRTLRRFGAARQGLAAIEFALMLPLMVLVLFGSVDVIDAFAANRRAENTAASLADVISRDTEVSDDEVDGVWAAMQLLVAPDNVSNITARITSIQVQDATTAIVVWSEGRGMSALSAGGSIALPNQMMIPGSSVILAETSLHYDPPMKILFPGAVDFEHRSYRRSREVDPIPRV